MLQETFSAGTSPIHRLDPRARIIMAALYAFIVALSNRFPALIAACAFSLVLVGVSRLPILELAKRIALVNGFVLFMWLVVPVTYPGAPLFSMGPLTVSQEGVLVSVRIRRLDKNNHPIIDMSENAHTGLISTKYFPSFG